MHLYKSYRVQSVRKHCAASVIEASSGAHEHTHAKKTALNSSLAVKNKETATRSREDRSLPHARRALRFLSATAPRAVRQARS